MSIIDLLKVRKHHPSKQHLFSWTFCIYGRTISNKNLLKVSTVITVVYQLYHYRVLKVNIIMLATLFLEKNLLQVSILVAQQRLF